MKFEKLKEKSLKLRVEVENGQNINDILLEAFALVRECGIMMFKLLEQLHCIKGK